MQPVFGVWLHGLPPLWWWRPFLVVVSVVVIGGCALCSPRARGVVSSHAACVSVALVVANGTITSEVSWGLGPGRIPFVDSPAGACGTAQTSRGLADAWSWLLLKRGAQFPEWLVGGALGGFASWPCLLFPAPLLGPGWLASPTRAPSFQL